MLRTTTLLLGVGILLAQVETSTAIRGLVTDPTGALVPGAKVSIRNTATGGERSATTGVSGGYSFPSVVPGNIRHHGNRARVQARRGEEPRGTKVTQTAQVDFALQVGETSESVTVSAVGAELINTSSAEVSGTIVRC